MSVERASSEMEHGDYEMVDYEPLLELRRFLRQEPRPGEYEWDEDDEDDEWEEFEDQDDLVSELIATHYLTKPSARTTCNFAAATLREPVSLLTKYRRQRQNSVYFREVFSSPHENLCKNLKIVKGSPLKQMQNVNEPSPNKA